MPFTHFSVVFAVAALGVMAVAALFIFGANLRARRSQNPVMAEAGGIVPYVALAGVLGFLLGLGLLVLQRQASGWLVVDVSSVLGGGCILLNAASAKSKRAAWPTVPGLCIEQALQKSCFSNGSGSRDGWRWSLVCEITYGGKNFRVTPKVRWSDVERQESPFWSEQEARQYISRSIGSGGKCKLRVNPANPLEAEPLH